MDKNICLQESTKIILIKYLNKIIDAEIKKSKKMNTNVIDKCVDWVLELKGIKIKLSDKEIKKRIRYINDNHYMP